MLNNSTANPPISTLLRRLTKIEVVVLFVAGPLLFFFPSLLLPLWPWQMLPFATVFLASVYSAAFVSTFIMVWSSRWSPARIVVPMIGIFTAVVLVVSFYYIDLLDLTNWVTWLWFLLYLILPINAFYHMWLYRDLPPINQGALPAGWRLCFQLLAAALGLYGLMMILLPELSTAFWPWPIDPFSSRLYSATFISPALAALYMLRGADQLEWITMGLTLFVLGTFSIVGIVWVDLAVQKINWADGGTWLWVALFGVIATIALGMIRKGVQPPAELA